MQTITIPTEPERTGAGVFPTGRRFTTHEFVVVSLADADHAARYWIHLLPDGAPCAAPLPAPVDYAEGVSRILNARRAAGTLHDVNIGDVFVIDGQSYTVELVAGAVALTPTPSGPTHNLDGTAVSERLRAWAQAELAAGASPAAIRSALELMHAELMHAELTGE